MKNKAEDKLKLQCLFIEKIFKEYLKYEKNNEKRKEMFKIDGINNILSHN